ncbi:MAG: hypothetical protein AABX51_02505 [Nanoarchaeota archaeon]
MKIAYLTLIFLLLIFAGCKQQTQTNNNLNSASIELQTYGGFVRPEYAKQVLRVEYGKVTYRIISSDGTITKEITKPISEEQFKGLAQAFVDSDFFSLKNDYKPNALVADVGTGELSFSIQGKEKTIIIDPYFFDEGVPAALGSLNDQLIQMISFAQETNAEDAKSIAEGWIKRAPTYKFDGFGLKLESQNELESFPVQHVLVYSFSSRSAGYGERTGQQTAQVVTAHTIRVTVVSGEVTAAIIDSKWDEISQQLVTPSEVEMSFDRMQCLKTPWDEWLENSDIRFVRAPTDEEVARMYFTQAENIEIKNFRKVTVEGVITCQACGVCWSGIRYYVTVSENDVDQMTRLGWKTSSIKPIN